MKINELARNDCTHCHGAGWLWRHELPASDWDGSPDDTRYRCVWCEYAELQELERRLVAELEKARDDMTTLGHGLDCERENSDN